MQISDLDFKHGFTKKLPVSLTVSINNLIIVFLSFLVIASWKCNGITHAIEDLSDGSIVTSVEFCYTNHLKRYDQTNGKVLHCRSIEHWAGGLVAVTLGEKQCLAISCKEYKSKDGKTR